MWAVYEENLILSGHWQGHSLAQVNQALGRQLTGKRAAKRFPLLIKFLDCQDWLSVQVHPNDEQARQLAGTDQQGKTEVWHILAADAQASIIAGVKANTSAEQLADAIRSGTILQVVKNQPVQVGDTFLIAAGTIHALGPGLLLYELQQTSDITYRVYDWERPVAAGRALHIEQSVAVSDPTRQPQHTLLQDTAPAVRQTLAECDYFKLESLPLTHSLELDTTMDTMYILTVVEGKAELRWQGQTWQLPCYHSVLLPAALGKVQLCGQPNARILLAS
jgi:mannose-6-phosphate isomerase